MADITVTAASVVPGATAQVKHGIAGETIPAGKAVVVNPDTSKVMLADNDSATAYVKGTAGVSVNSASLNQPISFVTDGPYTAGATVVKGETYCVSGTAGGICPRADVTTGDDLIVIGIADDAAIINVKLRDTGLTL